MLSRRIMFILVSVAVFALVAGVFSYWRITTAPDPSRYLPAFSTYTRYPLELTVGVNKTEFQQGEMIDVMFILKNVSNETIEIGWGGSKTFDFVIVDMDGKVVYESVRWYGTSYITWTLVLRPNEERRRHMEAIVMEGSSIFDVHDVPLVLQKGEYQVIGFTLTFDGKHLDSGQAIPAGTITTPPLTITIV